MDRRPGYPRQGTSRRSESTRPASGRPMNGHQPSNRRPNSGKRAPSARPAGYDRRMGSYDHRSPRRSPARNSRRRHFKIKPQFLIICAIILVILIYVLSTVFTVLFNDGTYCDGVTINGIPVTAYDKDTGAQYIASAFDSQLNTPYTLTHNGNSWTFTPADFGAQLDIGTTMDRAWNLSHIGNIFERAKAINSLKKNPIDLKVQINYDKGMVESYVDSLYDQVYRAPIDATVTIATDQPYLTGDSYEGEELDKECTIGMIETLIETGTGSTALPVLTLEPTFSSSRLSEGLEVIVEYNTDVSFRGYDSRYNVRKALGYFNGMCVSPGETINFNDIVGDRTEERGWKEATEYAGRNTTKGFGGGVCQASTTLYGAILKAGMDIIERFPHSQTVSYVAPSLDAAVFYGTGDHTKNLIFKNNTENPIYIYTEVTKETATVTIYGIRPAYNYELYSNILSQDATAVHSDYVYDVEGKYVYYANDKPVLYSKGHPACSSEGWLIAYDWNTGDEVSRKQLSNDVYSSGVDLYWVGIHNEDDSIISAKNS